MKAYWFFSVLWRLSKENYLLLNDIEYAFKLSFLNRCDDMERPIIEEYFQRSFGIDITDAKVVNVKE